MNIFDIGIILLFLMFLIVGFKNGVVKELAALIGIIVVFVLSFLLKGFIGNLLCVFLPFFKFTGNLENLTVINILLYQTIAFILVFSVLLGLYCIILHISSAIQKIVNLTIILWLPSKLLGALVSFIKGYIVLFAVFIVLMIPLKNQTIFMESNILNYMLYKTPVLSNVTSNFTNSVEEIYNLGEQVKNKEISSNNANLKALDIMLKYKVVNKSTIETLVKMKKLNISNINSVLNNY